MDLGDIHRNFSEKGFDFLRGAAGKIRKQQESAGGGYRTIFSGGENDGYGEAGFKGVKIENIFGECAVYKGFADGAYTGRGKLFNAACGVELGDGGGEQPVVQIGQQRFAEILQRGSPAELEQRIFREADGIDRRGSGVIPFGNFLK